MTSGNILKVAFVGKMGSGKTTAAELMEEVIRENMPVAAVNLKFANPIYDVVSLFARSQETELEVKPRQFMQDLGDIARRDFGDSVFERLFEREFINTVNLTNALPGNRLTMITCDDVRFIGEAHLLTGLGFHIIEIECPDDIRKARLGDAYVNESHRSEMELEEIEKDATVINDGTIEEFRENLKFTAGFLGLTGESVLGQIA